MRALLMLFLFCSSASLADTTEYIKTEPFTDTNCLVKILSEKIVCYGNFDSSILPASMIESFDLKTIAQFYQREDCPRPPDPSTDIQIRMDAMESLLVEVYNSLPEVTKPAFCYIKKILITEGASFNGAVVPHFDLSDVEYRSSRSASEAQEIGLRIDGYDLYLNQNIFNAELDSSQSEERNYRYIFLPKFNSGVNVTKTHAKRTVPTLQDVIVHEIGHLFDYSLGLNPILEDIIGFKSEAEGASYLNKDNWASLSWKTKPVFFKNPLECGLGESRFVFEPKTSFTKNAINAGDVYHIFSALEISSFTSLYASHGGPFEDFAEHYAMFVSKINYYISFDDNIFEYNLYNRPTNTVLNAKTEFISHIVENHSFDAVLQRERVWLDKAYYRNRDPLVDQSCWK